MIADCGRLICVERGGRMKYRRSLLLLTGAALVGLAIALPASSRPAQNERIVFESNQTGNSDIWIANADGTGQQNLTRDSTVDDISPAASPNGKLIVFARVRGERSELWLMNADGSGGRRLGVPKGSETHPAWSPTSDRIAFVRLLGGRWDVVVTDLNGRRRLLTSDAAPQYDVSWSPKGDSIVFDQLEKGTSDLWTVPSTGGRPTRITNTPEVAELNPAWSPIKNEIAYDAANSKGIYDLYVLDLGTNKIRRVTRDAADDGDPAWSSTGTMLAYRHEVGGDYEIWKVDATGRGKPSNVSNDPNGLELSPSWLTGTAAIRTTAAVQRAVTDPAWTFLCDAAYPGTPYPDVYTGDTQVNHMCGKAAGDHLGGCASPYKQADFLSGGSGGDYLYGWHWKVGKCEGYDRGDWLKARYSATDKDYVYGGQGYDRVLADAIDVLAADIEEIDT